MAPSQENRNPRKELRFGKELRDLFSNQSERHHELHARLLGLLVATAICDIVIAAVIALVLDEDALSSPSLALVWTTSQLLAGGSSLAVNSAWGHVLEVFLQLWGITVVAALAGSFAAFFHRRTLEQAPNVNSLEGSSGAGNSGGETTAPDSDTTA